MDIRPIGFAVWIASVAAVAACTPRSDERAAVDTFERSAARQLAPHGSGPQGQPQQQAQAPQQARGGTLATARQPAAAGVPATAAMGAAPTPLDPLVARAIGAQPRVDDAQITAQVKAQLAAAADLAGTRIDVDTRDGVVTLSGAVRSAATKARASEIARRVEQVRDVNDQLTLATS